MRDRVSKVPPPWFRCNGCGRNRAGHDLAETKVPAHLRHPFVSVTQAARERATEKSQTPLVEP